MDGHLPMEFVVKLEDAGVDMPTYHSLSFLDLSSPGFRKKVPANLDAFFLKLERRANEVREALRDYWVDEAAIKVTAPGRATQQMGLPRSHVGSGMGRRSRAWP